MSDLIRHQSYAVVVAIVQTKGSSLNGLTATKTMTKGNMIFAS